MKIIRSKYIPFKGFRAINLFGVLFVRNNAKLSEIDLNHETIHTAQMKELLYVPFCIGYVLEYGIRIIAYGLRYLGRMVRDKKRKFRLSRAYRKISFEREAYINEDDVIYLEDRKRFAWIKYLKN